MFHDLKFLYVNTQHGKRRSPRLNLVFRRRAEQMGLVCDFTLTAGLRCSLTHTNCTLHLWRSTRLWRSMNEINISAAWSNSVSVQYKTQIIQNSNLVTTGSVSPNDNATETIYFHISDITTYFLVLLHGPHASLGSYMLLYSNVGDSFYAMLTAFSTKHSLPVGWKGKGDL